MSYYLSIDKEPESILYLCVCLIRSLPLAFHLLGGMVLFVCLFCCTLVLSRLRPQPFPSVINTFNFLFKKHLNIPGHKDALVFSFLLLL